MLEKIMILVLAISSAVTAILGAISILYRIPDFFTYEFGKLEVSKTLDLEMEDSELGDFFSRFMMHGEDTFSLKAVYQGIERELFNAIEAGMMNGFRTLLDVLLGVFILSLIITVALIVILQFNKMSKQLRLSLNIGLVIYLVSLVGLIIYFNVYNGDAVMVDAFTNGQFVHDDLLHQMFEDTFTLHSTIAVCVISFIVMMAVRYVVWKLTAQKGIFSENLKGISK